MNKITCAEKDFYLDPEPILRDCRKQGAVLLVHSNNGCLVCAILTKEQFQKLLRGESID